MLRPVRKGTVRILEATAEQIRHSSSKQTPHLVNMRHCRRLRDHPSLRGSCLLGHWCQIASAERPVSTTVLSEPHRQPGPATDTGHQHLRCPPAGPASHGRVLPSWHQEHQPSCVCPPSSKSLRFQGLSISALIRFQKMRLQLAPSSPPGKVCLFRMAPATSS